MSTTKWHRLMGLALPILLTFGGAVVAWQPAPPDADVRGEADSNVEVMTRGPLHEAFGSPVTHDPVQYPVVKTQPPEPIEELPPDQRPEGDRVVWIPGYWNWDRDQEDFIWVSGLWRNSPPGRRWVPGYWNEVDAGWRWIPGAWVSAEAKSLTYHKQPPRSQERGPSSRSPSNDHFWVPGCWTHDQGRYKWRPGYWAPHQPGWVWVPACYKPAASGYVYHEGYWDHRVSQRGQLFAPIRFRGQARGQFTPSVALKTSTDLLLHLFVEPHSRSYVFGDYYGDQFVSAGYQPWFEHHRSGRGYDPLFSYYDWDYRRRDVNYLSRLQGWHKHFTSSPNLRPPITLAKQLTFAASHEGNADLGVSLLGAPLTNLVGGSSGKQFVQVGARQRASFSTAARQMLDLAGQRVKIESATRAVTGSDVRLPTESLKLPAVSGVRLPEVAPDVPDNPIRLRDVTPVVPKSVPDLPIEPRLPGLPF